MYLMKIKISKTYKDFFNKISSIGEIYLVGGFVRDAILGINNSDIDIAVSKSALNNILKFSEELGYPVNYDGLKFGVGTVFLSKNDKLDVAMFRSEFYNENSRKPITDAIDNIIDDLSRRDFTINSIAINYNSGEIIDPFGGILDIQNKILNCVGNPDERFSEDPLRMLRGIRFASKYKLSITSQTNDAIKRNLYRLEIISSERIREELLKGLKNNPKTYFRLLEKSGLLYQIFEEYKGAEFIKDDQRGRHHNETLIEHIDEILDD